MTSVSSSDVAGVTVGYRNPSSKTVAVRMTNRDAPGWSGVWALVYIAPDGAAAAQDQIEHPHHR